MRGGSGLGLGRGDEGLEGGEEVEGIVGANAMPFTETILAGARLRLHESPRLTFLLTVSSVLDVYTRAYMAQV